MPADIMLPYLLDRNGVKVESTLGDVVEDTEDVDGPTTLSAEFSSRL